MPTDSERDSNASLTEQNDNNAPMMAVFGGMFALMLVFLLLINVFSEAAVRERLKEGSEEETYRIERMDGGSGYSIIVFPGSIRIVETGEGIAQKDICKADSAYVAYARQIYALPNEQLLFFLLEGSIPTMAVARECLRSSWPDSQVHIGWVMADNEFLKSVVLDDIPDYIEDHANLSP